MMSVVNVTKVYVSDLWELRDKRVDSYPLLRDGPLPTLVVVGVYVLLVTVLGPLYMRDRRARDLKAAMILYNAFQVVYNVYLTSGGVRGGWLTSYQWICQPVDYSPTGQGALMLYFVYLYYLSKFIDLLDTLFFVARKKFNQITFLHVAHHAIMPVYLWVYTIYIPGGHGSLPGFVNAVVHIVMYTYYLLAALGPRMRRWLWWKPLLTWMQMIQFMVVIMHMLTLLIFEGTCHFPREYAYVCISLNIFFLVLFANFYVQTYLIKKNDNNEQRPEAKNGSAKAIKKE